MNFSGESSKISKWMAIKKNHYRSLLELKKFRLTYNSSILPMTSLAWEIDPVQHRFIFMANKGIAIADTFDKNHTDATLLPEVLFPRRGFIRDLTWFPNDNSLTAILSNTGSFNLIDMNNMVSVDSFDLNTPSLCIKFDKSRLFPFCVAIGTDSGLRFCDLKSGSQVQLLKTKFEVCSIEFSANNKNEVYTGLSNGKVMIWDLRMSNRPINELAHPKKAESAVNQIIHSTASFGTIISGYENGDIISYSSSDIGNESWNQLLGVPKKGGGKFALTTYGEIIYPVREKILFIDPLYGDITAVCESEILNSPSSIIVNENNNDIFIFDSSHVGTIFRFNPQNLIDEN